MSPIQIRRSWNWMSSGSLLRTRRTMLGIWIALCRKNRKAGRLCHWRSQPSHLPPLVVGAIPLAYGTGHCFTDFWRAYQAVIPEEQQTAVGKETGETERAGTLEHYAPTTLGSLMTRKTLSFSK